MDHVVEIKWHMGWINERYYALGDGQKDIVNFLTRLVYTSWLQIQAYPRFLNQQGQSVNATWIRPLPSLRHEPCSHVIPGYKPMVVSNQWVMNQMIFSIFGTYIWLFKTFVIYVNQCAWLWWLPQQWFNLLYKTLILKLGKNMTAFLHVHSYSMLT